MTLRRSLAVSLFASLLAALILTGLQGMRLIHFWAQDWYLRDLLPAMLPEAALAAAFFAILLVPSAFLLRRPLWLLSLALLLLAALSWAVAVRHPSPQPAVVVPTTTPSISRAPTIVLVTADAGQIAEQVGDGEVGRRGVAQLGGGHPRELVRIAREERKGVGRRGAHDASDGLHGLLPRRCGHLKQEALRVEHALVGSHGPQGVTEPVFAHRAEAEQPHRPLGAVLGRVGGAFVELREVLPPLGRGVEPGEGRERSVVIGVEADRPGLRGIAVGAHDERERARHERSEGVPAG